MTTEDQGGAESAGSRTFNVEVDGTSLTVTVTPADDAEKPQPAAPGEQSFRIAVDGRGFCVQVESGTSNAAESTINVPPAVRTPQRSAPATAPKPASTQAASTTAAGETALTAPIPGTVVRYTVSEAQQVKAGEAVVVLEAMKMENTLPAPVDGVIKQIPLQAGAKVARGDVLLVIGPA
jgi:oxaloacetate decarboxylase alpha subunit/pyruvate carboxylase subunit B